MLFQQFKQLHTFFHLLKGKMMTRKVFSVHEFFNKHRKTASKYAFKEREGQRRYTIVLPLLTISFIFLMYKNNGYIVIAIISKRAFRKILNASKCVKINLKCYQICIYKYCSLFVVL